MEGQISLNYAETGACGSSSLRAVSDPENYHFSGLIRKLTFSRFSGCYSGIIRRVGMDALEPFVEL